jgi:hypothetical protein
MKLTGCLQKGTDGNFTLSNVQADASSASGASRPTGTAGAGTPGAAGATPGATPGSAAAGAGAGANAASATWTLRGGTDLASHVGHRIEVTGRSSDATTNRGAGSAGAGRPDAATPGATPGATAGATPGTTAANPDAAANRPAAGASAGGSANMSNARTLEVQSVRMIAQTCP